MQLKTPDKRVEEVQQSIKNLLYKAQEKNWKNGGVSIYDLSDLQEASDKVITQYHQDMMREVVEKIETEIDRIKDGDIKWVGLRRALVIIKSLDN